MSNIFTNLWNNINSSTFLSIVFTALIILISWCFFVYMIRLLSNIRSYIVNRVKSIQLENQKASNISVSLSMPERIELTNSILDLIAFMVNNEIIAYFKTITSLQTSYNIANMDHDIEYIATKVYEGINKELFTNPNLILTDKYLMEYITKKTTSTILEITQIHNDNIRNANQSTGD